MWLFFGCRSESQDWIFRREMEGFLSKGTLSKLSTAFSRDSSEKVYVQVRCPRASGLPPSRPRLWQSRYREREQVGFFLSHRAAEDSRGRAGKASIIVWAELGMRCRRRLVKLSAMSDRLSV